MINLRTETIDFLKHHNKTEQDVKYVIIHNIRCSFEYFLDLVKNMNYDNGYGIPYIREGIYCIGEDWWISRYEYDGSEYWKFNQKPEYTNTNYEEITLDDILYKN